MIYSIVRTTISTGEPDIVESFSDKRDAEHYINSIENDEDGVFEFINKAVNSDIYNHYARENNYLFPNKKILKYKYSIGTINGTLNPLIFGKKLEHVEENPAIQSNTQQNKLKKKNKN